MSGSGAGGNNTLRLGKYFHRNSILSILSGVFFAFGWWIIIDATCQYPLSSDFNKIYHLIGAVATLALILTNSISNSQIRDDATSDSCLGRLGARLFLFFSFLLVFGSLIASAWIFFGYYIPLKKDKLYPGFAIFSQNLSIFISTLIVKLGRKENRNDC